MLMKSLDTGNSSETEIKGYDKTFLERLLLVI